MIDRTVIEYADAATATDREAETTLLDLLEDVVEYDRAAIAATETGRPIGTAAL